MLLYLFSQLILLLLEIMSFNIADIIKLLSLYYCHYYYYYVFLLVYGTYTVSSIHVYTCDYISKEVDVYTILHTITLCKSSLINYNLGFFTNDLLKH